MSGAIENWLQSKKYLPAFMRDFHDQKDLFKTIDMRVRRNPADLVQRPDWIAAHVYVIDVFLWFMARRGYTLQRTRKPLPFRDIKADIAETMAKLHDQEAAVLASAFTNATGASQ